MTGVIYRFRIFFIAFALVAAGLLFWLLISRQNGSEIPSRGVFVIENTIGNSSIYCS